MIVVIGRPGLMRRPADGRPDDGHLVEGGEVPAGLAASVASATARAGGRVELVGSIGDDAEGDRLAVLLGRAGIGHAALLRDPAGHTPVADLDRGPMPRLDAADVSLGLGYLADVRVLVLAETIEPEAQAAIIAAADFHNARLVALVAAKGETDRRLAEAATVIEAPSGDVAPFAEMVGLLAVALDGGRDPAVALAEAAAAAGWERSTG